MHVRQLAAIRSPARHGTPAGRDAGRMTQLMQAGSAEDIGSQAATLQCTLCTVYRKSRPGHAAGTCSGMPDEDAAIAQSTACMCSLHACLVVSLLRQEVSRVLIQSCKSAPMIPSGLHGQAGVSMTGQAMLGTMLLQRLAHGQGDPAMVALEPVLPHAQGHHCLRTTDIRPVAR